MISEQDSGLIVIVEDPFLCNFMRSVLTRAGFSSVGLEAGEAVNLIRSGQLHITALITNAPQAFREVIGPIPLIYSTSCPSPDATAGIGHWRVLPKPFQAAKLVQVLHEVSASVLP
jgi:hypothetical protein